MTPSQKEILNEVQERLKDAFADALQALTVPGTSRTWFVGYLKVVLREFIKLYSLRVDGKQMSKVLAPGSREAIRKLLRKTSNRDPKTISRWAVALNSAFRADVSPKALRDWLSEGGGVSGRALARRHTHKR